MILQKCSLDDCSSIEFLVLIKKTKWLLLTLLSGIRLLTFYLRIFPSETAWPNKAKFYRKHLWKVLYKISSFHLKWTKNMVAIGNSCFWMAIIYKIFSSETRRDNEFLLCRNAVWEVLYKISIFRADRTANMAAIENKHVHHGIFFGFLAHLTQRVMWAIAITWRPSYVVNFFKNLLLWKY